jgi:hypothetical protein
MTYRHGVFLPTRKPTVIEVLKTASSQLVSSLLPLFLTSGRDRVLPYSFQSGYFLLWLYYLVSSLAALMSLPANLLSLLAALSLMSSLISLLPAVYPLGCHATFISVSASPSMSPLDE